MNPVEEKRREREQATTRTFGALADRYLKEHARRFKKTAEADERALTVHILPKWGTRPYHSIGRRDVIELCEGLVAAGKPIQANRVQALVSKMFSFAVDADLLPANPGPLRRCRIFPASVCSPLPSNNFSVALGL